MWCLIWLCLGLSDVSRIVQFDDKPRIGVKVSEGLEFSVLDTRLNVSKVTVDTYLKTKLSDFRLSRFGKDVLIFNVGKYKQPPSRFFDFSNIRYMNWCGIQLEYCSRPDHIIHFTRFRLRYPAFYVTILLDSRVSQCSVHPNYASRCLSSIFDA